MKNPFFLTGLLSLALWATIVHDAFLRDTVTAWVLTVFLVGWGIFGLAYGAKRDRGSGQSSQ